MQALRQPQSEQGFTLPALLQRPPAMGCSGLVERVNAEMGREILLPRCRQRIKPGLTIAVGHQGAIRPAWGVVTRGLKGVIDHQQSACGDRTGQRTEPGWYGTVPLGCPAVLYTHGWELNP